MKKILVAGLATALAVGGALGSATAAHAAAPPADADRGPVAKGAAWTAGQVPASGVFHTYSSYFDTETQMDVAFDYDDVGVTIDAARALAFAGGHPATVTAMTDGIVGGLPDYYSGFGTTYANTTAKAASYLLEVGRTGPATDAAVEALRSTVSDTAPIAGRVEDQNNDFGDGGSPIGQAFAVQGLAAAAAPELASAKAYLLDQQCTAGFIRASFGPKTGDQTCDGATSPVASADTTAITVLALQDLAATDTAVATALDKAVAWLATQQAADGSLGNANTTGLAGWAMGVEGDTASAADAAAWVRAHQLTNAGACAPYAAADNGAIAVDDLGLANAKTGPLDDIDRSSAFRATAQALPVLAWSRGGALGLGRTRLTAPTTYVKAGSTQRVTVQGAPGNTLCVKVGTATAKAVVLPATGTTTVTVPLPGVTRKTVVSTVDGAGRATSAAITGLAAKRLPVTIAKKVKKGGKALVRTSGLRAGEKVKVLLRGKVVAQGVAGARGNFTKRIAVKGKPGKAKVVVVGQFPDRRGSVSVTVVR